MNFYSFDDITAAADCRDIARELYSATVHSDGRCACTWRGGDNPQSGSVTASQWYDHAQKIGGGAVQLVAYHFGGDVQQAQNWLGERYNLTPKHSVRRTARKSRYDELVADGYIEVARYNYNDADGNPVHHVVRLEHPDPDKGKQFVQGTPTGWGLRDTTPILYNLAAVIASPWVCVVEGEKDADRLAALGIPATTCSGGAKKWTRDYSEALSGKQVAILPDNDEPGAEHAKIIAASLVGVADAVKIVTTSTRQKGDVSDYLNDGHSAQELLTLIAAAPTVAAEEVEGTAVPERESPEVLDAKHANQIPFRNFVPVQVENDDPRKKGKTELVKQPRTIEDMVGDLHRRFLGFPRRVGGQLFDHDRATGEIYNINRASDLFAWIGRKSHHPVEWGRGDALAGRDDLLSAAMAEAQRYEAISSVPDWPQRPDVYYIHPKLPPPSEGNRLFRGLIDFFCLASEADERMLMAYFAAPLWFIPKVPRPSWVIDSEEGQGCGKSTIAEACALLYDTEPVSTCPAELQYGEQEIVKRLLCSNGRRARIMLIDNVTGTFSSPVLASLITKWSISGKRPYGPGEETRPNNLTYTITANDATVDTDIASRSFYIFVRKPKFSPEWKIHLLAYIDRHRYEIIADMIDMMERHKPFAGVHARTRFAEFETRILQAMCEHVDIYEHTLERLDENRTESNIEEDQARLIQETIASKLEELNINPETETVWIRSQVVNSWGRLALQDGHDYAGRPIQLVRSLAKQRKISAIDPRLRRWPTRGSSRSSGVLWGDPAVEPRYVIKRNPSGAAEKELVM